MNLVHFESWPEVLAYAKASGPLYYQAPLDRYATQLFAGKNPPGYEVRARSIRVYPPGSAGRGRNRTSDPFTADAGHLDRFSRPIENVVHESRPGRPATLILGRDGMGPEADEADFDAWVRYVSDRIDEYTGLDVTIEERRPRDVQDDRINAASDYDRQAIREALHQLWDEFTGDTSAWPQRAQEGGQQVRAQGRPAPPQISEARETTHELVLYIENESDLSPDGPRGQGRDVLLTALRRWRKGTYDPALAVKLFGYLAESGAKRYAKEFATEREWSTIFTPATRLEAAKELEASFRNSAEHGEYDHVDVRPGGLRASSGRQIDREGVTPSSLYERTMGHAPRSRRR